MSVRYAVWFMKIRIIRPNSVNFFTLSFRDPQINIRRVLECYGELLENLMDRKPIYYRPAGLFTTFSIFKTLENWMDLLFIADNKPRVLHYCFLITQPFCNQAGHEQNWRWVITSRQFRWSIISRMHKILNIMNLRGSYWYIPARVTTKHKCFWEVGRMY